MSILIKGMEMPENCHECEFVDFLPTCPCNKMADEDFWNNVSLAVEGHKDCPLVPVPPHGRLIDADVLNHKIYCEIPFKVFKNVGRVSDMVLLVCEAPTIIEAEGE